MTEMFVYSIAAVWFAVGAVAPTPLNTGSSRTVLAWIEGNMTEVADFVLRGLGRGAVNAVSHTSMFRVAEVREHHATTVCITGVDCVVSYHSHPSLCASQIGYASPSECVDINFRSIFSLLVSQMTA